MGKRVDRGIEKPAGGTAERRVRFEPLRVSTRRQRALLFILGPLLWVMSLVVIAEVNRHGESVLIALVVLGGALLVGLVTLLPMRWGRIREERRER